MYKIEITKSVEKDFKKIPLKNHTPLFDAIENLASNPFPVSQHKKLKGTSNSYRLRVGNFRILYDVEGKIKIITVYRVRHRKDVYKR
ncbi:MAG: type II toxin-antitoxin system RelE/ParE family toxin [Melioribacteraceae bacterium]|nr:type II toxin-antitoxin system RelE/ParE family toxin [Melioribacteraceae bacterium]